VDHVAEMSARPKPIAADVAAVVREILGEVQALRREVAELRGVRRRAGTDAAAKDQAELTRLLPALRAVVGDATFVVGDLMDDRRTRAALAETLGAGPRAGQRLGQLLSRNCGAEIAGLAVASVGRTPREGQAWRIERCDAATLERRCASQRTRD
jgi:hypothetical protein